MLKLDRYGVRVYSDWGGAETLVGCSAASVEMERERGRVGGRGEGGAVGRIL